MNIDQALIALCEKHDLSALSYGVSIDHVTGHTWQTSFANWYHHGVNTARMGRGATPQDAIAHAIQQVNEARACVVDVPEMELGEVVL
jgi:hypothetical protein